VLTLACASHGLPGLHGYSIVVEEKDPQSVELARALREHGVKIKSRVKGGSGHTAELIYFTFSDPDASPPETTWLHLRLADTRSGVIVRATAIPLDSARRRRAPARRPPFGHYWPLDPAPHLRQIAPRRPLALINREC